MPAVEIRRNLRPEDVAEIDRLLAATERADGRRPLSDHLWVDLHHGTDPRTVAALARSEDLPHPAGYAQASPANDGWATEVVLDPALRNDAMRRSVELLGALVDELRHGAGDGTITWWVHEPTNAEYETAELLGWRAERQLLQMRRPLPIDEPVTIATRPYVPVADDDAWLSVNNRAFADHGEQGGWDHDMLGQRRAEPWFDPEGFLLHERDGRLAGFCWTKLHHDTEPVLGEIYVIAVDPDFHGLGLGRQLTLAGLASIAQRGVGTAMLHVDADNDAAVGLYRSLGFETHHTDVAFVGELADTRTP